MALFVSAFGGALLSEKWPPWWTNCNFLAVSLPVIVVVVAWLFFMYYLGFQLRNRRWVAIRLAATEHVLTSWSCQRPTPEELQPVVLSEQGQEDSLLRRYFWPSKSMPIKLDVVPLKFPKAFADALADKARLGSAAVHHERVFYLLSWGLFLALLLKTIVALLTTVVSSG